jgi:hypothetical protein
LAEIITQENEVPGRLNDMRSQQETNLTLLNPALKFFKKAQKTSALQLEQLNFIVAI